MWSVFTDRFYFDIRRRFVVKIRRVFTVSRYARTIRRRNASSFRYSDFLCYVTAAQRRYVKFFRWSSIFPTKYFVHAKMGNFLLIWCQKHFYTSMGQRIAVTIRNFAFTSKCDGDSPSKWEANSKPHELQMVKLTRCISMVHLLYSRLTRSRVHSLSSACAGSVGASFTWSRACHDGR